MPIFRKTMSAPEKSSTERRFWRGKKSGGNMQKKRTQRRFWRRKKSGGSVKKKSKASKGWSMMELRIKGAEKIGIATARVQEKLTNIGHWLSYQLYTFTHPCSPFRRRAAKRSKEQSKLGATGILLSLMTPEWVRDLKGIASDKRRIHKEAMARSKSHEKRSKFLKKQRADDAEHAKLLLE